MREHSENVTTGRLDPGDYYWTVKGTVRGLDVSAREVNGFTVLPIPPLPAPVQSYPLPGSVLGPAELRAAASIPFNWEAVPEATNYVFSLYRETSSVPLVHSDVLREHAFLLSDLSILDRGTYRWTVRAHSFDDDGELVQNGTIAESDFHIELPPLRASSTNEIFYGR